MGMDRTSPAKDPYHLLLFLLLSALFVVCGAHLLETVCHSIGLTGPHNWSIGKESGFPAQKKGTWYMIYRWFMPGFCLIFGYHCFSLKEWARRGLAGLLAVDLIVWFFRTVFLTLLYHRIRVVPEKTVVQLSVVLLETSLLWVLTHPRAGKHFLERPEKGNQPIP